VPTFSVLYIFVSFVLYIFVSLYLYVFISLCLIYRLTLYMPLIVANTPEVYPGAEPATSVQSPPIVEEVPSPASALATLSLVSDLSLVPHPDQGQ
jgi:hypothetical protein